MQRTREQLAGLIARDGLESVLDALRGIMGETARSATFEDQDALYEATGYMEQAWMTVPVCGRAD